MEKLPLIELAELNKSIIFRDSFQDIFSIADLDGGMDIGDPDSPERFAPMRLNALLMVLTFEGTLEIHLDYVSYIVKPNRARILGEPHLPCARERIFSPL